MTSDAPGAHRKRERHRRAVDLILGSTRALQRKLAPRAERILLVASAVIFVVASVLAYLAFPNLERGVRWAPVMALAAIGAPGMILLNTLEYLAMGRLLSYRISFVSALRISFLSSAANMMPLPGAAVVRIQALRQKGARTMKASAAAATVASTWLGVTGMLAGGLQVGAGRPALAGGLLTIGIAGLVLAIFLLRFSSVGPGTMRIGALILCAEIAFVLLISLQFFLAFLALGLEVSISQAAVFSVPVVFASAVGFLPGALGLRELLAAAFSPLAGLPAAAGLVAAALDRLVAAVMFTILIGALTLVWAIRGRRGPLPSLTTQGNTSSGELAHGSERPVEPLGHGRGDGNRPPEGFR